MDLILRDLHIYYNFILYRKRANGKTAVFSTMSFSHLLNVIEDNNNKMQWIRNAFENNIKPIETIVYFNEKKSRERKIDRRIRDDLWRENVARARQFGEDIHQMVLRYIRPFTFTSRWRREWPTIRNKGNVWDILRCTTDFYEHRRRYYKWHTWLRKPLLHKISIMIGILDSF